MIRDLWKVLRGELSSDMYDNVQRLLVAYSDQARERRQIDQYIHALGRAVGRILAKIDPMYSIDETDPSLKAASDAIGNAVIAKLLAEVQVTDRQEGKYHD